MPNRKLSASSAQLIDSDASDGEELDIGSIRIRYRLDTSSTTVEDDDEDGWGDLGIVMNDLDLKPTIEAFEAMVGSPSTMQDKALIGKKMEFDINLIAVKDIAKALANGNTTITYTEPATPVTTTVDLTTFVPDHESLVLTSVTDLNVGDQIIVKTGTVANGQVWERLTITAKNVTDKQVWFNKKYVGIPIDTAPVKKIIGVEFENKGKTLPSMYIRIEKQDNGKDALTVFVFEKVKIEPTSRKLGVKSPSEVGLKFSVIPKTKVTLRSGFTPLVEHVFNTEKVIY